MKRQQTIFAAFHKPIKIELSDSVDTIMLQINRIGGTRFKTVKEPLQLLKEMPALNISENIFYAGSTKKIRQNSKLSFASAEEILLRQSEFMKDFIEEHKQSIKDISLRRLNESNARNQTRMNSKNKEMSDDNQNFAKYLISSKIVIILLLIPFFLLLILFTTLYFNA